MVKFLPIFHPLIEADVREAMARYNGESPGLGARFRRAFYAAVDDLLVFPEKHPVKHESGLRTRLMRPFPYFVFHAVESEVVFVLPVQYAGRSPGFLQSIARQRRST